MQKSRLNMKRRNSDRIEIDTGSDMVDRRDDKDKEHLKTSMEILAKMQKKKRVKRTGKKLKEAVVKKNQTRNVDKNINAGIYILKDVQSGHCYFGSTWDLKNAEQLNLQELKLKIHPHRALIKAMLNDGRRDIRFQIIEKVKTGPEFNYKDFEMVLQKRLLYHFQAVVRKKALFMLLMWRKSYCKMLWPKWKRAMTRMKSNEMFAAAVQIQNLGRYYKAKKEYNTRRAIHMIKQRHGSSIVIQKYWRGFYERQKYKQYGQKQIQHRRAIKIQCMYRTYAAKNRVRQNRVSKHRHTQAVMIQKHIRGCLLRNAISRQCSELHNQKAAIAIQCGIRRKIAYRRAHEKRINRGAFEKENSAVIVIQEMYFYYIGRKLQWIVNDYYRKMTALTCIHNAYMRYKTAKLQWAVKTYYKAHIYMKRFHRTYRLWLNRKNLRDSLERLKRINMATDIQRIARGYIARNKVAKMYLNRKKHHAAKQIQHCWQRHKHRKLRKLLLLEKQMIQNIVRIQSCYRKYLARKHFSKLLQQSKIEKSVLKIQSQYRVFQSRKRIRQKLWIRRNGPCQDCFDELAECFSPDFQMELCINCFKTLVDYEVEETGYDNDREYDRKAAKFKTVPIKVHRHRVLSATKLQAFYRGYQTRCLLRRGACSDCTKSIKLYCFDCKLCQCYSCAGALHEHPSFAKHKVLKYKLYQSRIQMAIVLQKNARRYLQRNTLAKLRLTRDTVAAQFIQSFWRSRFVRMQARRDHEAHVLLSIRKGASSIIIQRWTRCWMTRALIRRRILCRNMAIRIQCMYRYWKARKIVKFRKYHLEVLEKLQNIVIMQCCVRRYIARRKVKQLLHEILRVHSAKVIQAHYRDHRAKCIRCARKVQRKFRWHRKVQKRSASKIQRWYHYHYARRHAQATIIQCALRCCLARMTLTDKLAARTKKLEEYAAKIARQKLDRNATVIQRKYRAYRKICNDIITRKECVVRMRMIECKVCELQERSSVKRVQRSYRIRLYRRRTYIVKIQSVFRRVHAVQRVCRLKSENILLRATIIIQRYYRGYTCRKQLAALQITPDAIGGWEEIWDEASQSSYYYNHDTGETTWDSPFVIHVDTDNPDEWTEHWDDIQQAMYYYNTITGETTWEMPAYRNLVNIDS